MMTTDELAEMNANLGPAAPKDETYRPYCLICPTMLRMELQPGLGFRCQACHNPIGFDLLKRRTGVLRFGGRIFNVYGARWGYNPRD